MNRARAYNAVLHTLLIGLLMLAVTLVVSAQINRARDTKGGLTGRMPASTIALARNPATRLMGGTSLTKVPTPVTKRRYVPRKDGKGPTRVAGDNVAVRQTQLITKRNPSDQVSATPAPSQDEHPSATADEKHIFFDSDRADAIAIPQTSTGVFNIFRMNIDGSGMAQITSGSANKIEPADSPSGSRLAYVSGGNYTNFSANVDNPPTAGFSLFFIDLNGGGAPVSLTQNNPSGFTFVDVRHPTWASGGDKIAFAGRRDTDPTHYHIFIVDVQSDVITQMTSGLSNDYAPAWSPNGRLIAFTTNATNFPGGAAPLMAPATTANDDIWVLNPNAFTPDPARVTQFAINGKQSNNKNPAWSTLRFDPLNIATPEVDVNGNPTTGPNLLAFASNRADTDTTQPGVATDVLGTYDIYWMRASIKPDPFVGGSYTVTTPEDASPSGNHALKLRTSTPDTAIDPNDPATMFDPNFVSNEDYPTWPQYISSYRIFYQSDHALAGFATGVNLNIFGSTIFDINAPSLLKFSIENNEILRVVRDVQGTSIANLPGLRQFNAGETVRFGARIVDYESGVESAYVQIKNPNGSPQSADGVEHKTYVVGPGVLDTNGISVINAPYEFDSQAINPSTNLYRKPGRLPLNTQFQFGAFPNNWPGWNMYVAGFDDQNAMSGVANPPDDDQHDFSGSRYNDPEGGFWLRMWDDGPISAGGHEPEGEKRGDGIYTAVWQTPSDQPSDFYLDLIVRDMAVDPFNTPSDIRGINWKIYDNVWGFSTAPFLGKGNWLYVNDYDSGQRFFETSAGSVPRFAGTGAFGWPTESWNTEFDPALYPTTAIQAATNYELQNFLTPLGLHSYGGSGIWNTDPTVTIGPDNVPVTGSYDQWRILSRGPVPDSVLNAYRGHLEVQPPDLLANSATPNQVFVAEKAVIWHSPYTGRLFVGPGTLLDNDTQTRLTTFVKSGGRLLVNGGQIAYGLALGQTGGGTSPFLNSILHVTYVNDFLLNIPNDNQITTIAGQGPHPIASETFYGPPLGPFQHLYPSTPSRDYPSSGPIYVGSTTTVARSYMALDGGTGFDNVVLFTAPINNQDISNVDAFYSTQSVSTGPCVMWFTDVSAKPIVSKIVFSPFGWEQINPEYFTLATPNRAVLKNRRVEMLHNAGDHLRTGRIVGVIRDVNGLVPVNHVFLRAVSLNGINLNKTIATAYSQADGSYTLSGLDANGVYDIQGQKAGFITHTQFANAFHGADQARLDFLLTQAQPGSISGKATLLAGGAPATGLIVVAQSVSDPKLPVYTGTTDVNGAYTIKNAAPDVYMVSIAPNTPGNRTALGYGDSVPGSYGFITLDPTTSPPSPIVPAGWPDATPPPAVATSVTVGTTPGSRDILAIDFKLKQAPGRILGKVTDKTNGQPISGATVTAVTGASSFSANTIADGTYIIPNVDPGTYVVTAAAPGFANASISGVAVSTGKDTVGIDIALTPVPPGSLSGLVATTSGVPIGGAAVTVKRLDGTLLQTSTTGTVQTEGTYKFNYRFSNNIPAGAKVLVDASKSGFTNKTGVLTVGPINPGPSGPEIQGVNFSLDPLFTFPNSLTLVSAPYEYTTDIAALFSIPGTDVASKAFAFVWFDPTAAQYVYYPTPPANTFHLGVGYFLQETNTQFPLALTTAGALAPLKSASGSAAQPDYATYSINLKTGWNLIGDPFVYSLNFLTCQIQEQDGSIKDVLTAQSGSNPALGSALWTYENGNYQVVFTLDSFRGYWLRAFRDVKLLVVPTSQQGRATVMSPFKTLYGGNAQGSGWKLNLIAESGGTRSAPGIVGVNAGATDSYDVFKLESPPSIGTRSVALTFDHKDWGARAGSYSVDVRSTATAQQKWSMNLVSNVSGEPVTITWPTMATVPGKYDVILTDEDAKTTVRMRNQISYTIPAGKAAGPVTRHFTVSVERAQRGVLSLTNITARVNVGTRGPVSAEIGYNLTSSATVQVNVTSRNGRSLRTLEQGVTRAAGIGQAIWDLRQADGTPAPADTYNVEVTATDSSGRKVRQQVPLLLTR